MRQRQQGVQRIAEAGGAGRDAVARIGAGQRGREVGDGQGRAVERHAQRRIQPLLTGQALLAHLLGHEGGAVAVHRGLFQIEVGRAEGFGALGQRGAEGVAVGGQCVEVGP
ncbi:hypothetical protein D3C72_2010620 [compost metagenome]